MKYLPSQSNEIFSPLVMEILQKLKDINVLTSACATIKKIQIKIAMLIFFSLWLFHLKKAREVNSRA